MIITDYCSYSDSKMAMDIIFEISLVCLLKNMSLQKKYVIVKGF